MHLHPSLLLGLALVAAQGASPPPSLTQLIPSQAILSLEIHHPPQLLEPLLTSAFATRLAGLPGYDALLSSPKFQELQGGIRYFESIAGEDWRAVSRKLTRSGIAFAAAGNRTLLVLDGTDAPLLQKLHETARQIAVAEADKLGESGRVRSTDYAGVAGWSFNGKEAHAIVDQRLVLTSGPDVLKAVLDLRTGGTGSLSDRPDYAAARKAVGPDAAGMAFVDLARLRQAPGFLDGLDAQRQNPLLALLLAGLPTDLKSADWLALGIYVDGPTLALRAFAGPQSATALPAFAKPTPESAGAPSALRVPHEIATLNLFRDLAAFYAAKDDLFPQRTSGLIFFENMMGIFFSGRNLTDEVLARTQPQVRLVAARQQFDPAIGTPEPQWPAFALVLGLRDAASFGEVLEEAWQKALGLVNFTRGQKALPGLILDKADHHGTPITLARFSDKDVPDRQHLDQRFNFRPTLAVAHGHAILSSTDQLARDLIDALGKAQQTSLGAIHTLLHVSGPELAAILRANRPALVRDTMLKKGQSLAEAGQSIDTFCAVVGLADSAAFSLGAGPQQPLAELKLRFPSF